MKTKTRSSYSLRLERRKRCGDVRYVLPVDDKGLATLNKGQFVKDHTGQIKTRVFTRLYRSNEI
jgi:hypothetical protein